jgi:hypothetical protein
MNIHDLADWATFAGFAGPVFAGVLVFWLRSKFITRAEIPEFKKLIEEFKADVGKRLSMHTERLNRGDSKFDSLDEHVKALPSREDGRRWCKARDQRPEGRHQSGITPERKPAPAAIWPPGLGSAITCVSASNTILTGTIPASTLPLSFSGVAKRTSRPQFGDWFNLGTNNPSLFFVQGSADTGGIANIGVAGTVVTTMVDNAFHAVVGNFNNSTNGAVYVDGAAKVTGSGLSTTAGATQINLGGVSGSVVDGLITEAIYWAGIFTDAQAAALIANDRAYYGF